MSEPRGHKRYPIALKVQLQSDEDELEAWTRTVSLVGFDITLATFPKLGDKRRARITLPDEKIVEAECEMRNVSAERLCGFRVSFPDGGGEAWRDFIEQESRTGSMWSLIGRFASASGDEKEAVRTQLERGKFGALFTKLGGAEKSDIDDETSQDVTLRYHMVGENGEAYRICFERMDSQRAVDSDFVDSLPGFAHLASSAVKRILKEPITIRPGRNQAPTEVYICQLARGGYAYIRGGVSKTASLVGLCAGEMVLIGINAQPCSPNFTREELERIACDSFRQDMVKPVFKGPIKEIVHKKPKTHKKRWQSEDEIRTVLFEAKTWERRVYGEKEIMLYPEHWCLARDESGEVRGPAMRDGDRILMLGLVGSDCPRVLKLVEVKKVRLMESHEAEKDGSE